MTSKKTNLENRLGKAFCASKKQSTSAVTTAAVKEYDLAAFILKQNNSNSGKKRRPSVSSGSSKKTAATAAFNNFQGSSDSSCSTDRQKHTVSQRLKTYLKSSGIEISSFVIYIMLHDLQYMTKLILSLRMGAHEYIFCFVFSLLGDFPFTI